MKIKYIFFLLYLFSKDVLAEISLKEFHRQQITDFNCAKGIISKGDWSDLVIPIEITIIGDEINHSARINRERSEQIKFIETSISFNIEHNWINSIRTLRVLKTALQSISVNAGQYRRQNHIAAPYNENNFPSYYGNSRLIKKAEDDNYVFYSIKIVSEDKRKWRAINNKTIHGKTCYVFLFYDGNDKYVFSIYATTNTN
jgi:hypothetical protein